jgi:hypothetical protein
VSLRIERTNAPSKLARTSTTTIPLTFLKIKSSEKQQSRKGCESLIGWVSGVNARVCDVIVNRTCRRSAVLYPACCVVDDISAALWQFAAN